MIEGDHGRLPRCSPPRQLARDARDASPQGLPGARFDPARGRRGPRRRASRARAFRRGVRWSEDVVRLPKVRTKDGRLGLTPARGRYRAGLGLRSLRLRRVAFAEAAEAARARAKRRPGLRRPGPHDRADPRSDYGPRCSRRTGTKLAHLWRTGRNRKPHARTQTSDLGLGREHGSIPPERPNRRLLSPASVRAPERHRKGIR